MARYKASGVCLKVHERGGHRVLAACDAELLGKTFGKIGFFVNPEFYGEPAEDSELIRSLDSCDIVNLVGKRVIEFAIKRSLASRKQVLKIGEVPHLQIVRLGY